MLACWGGGGHAEKQACRKNVGVLLERVRFIVCTITFAYLRQASRLSRRNLEKVLEVRPPSLYRSKITIFSGRQVIVIAIHRTQVLKYYRTIVLEYPLGVPFEQI